MGLSVLIMDPEDVNINGDTPETPLIAKRAVTKSGTPKNVGYVPSIVYFVLCMYSKGVPLCVPCVRCIFGFGYEGVGA